MPSNRYPSNSGAASAQSIPPRTSLAEDDLSFIAKKDLRSGDANEGIINRPPKIPWLDHLLAIFCVKSSSSTLPINAKEYPKQDTFDWHEVCWQASVFLPLRYVCHNILARLHLPLTSPVSYFLLLPRHQLKILDTD
jgi:hypothetical protein